MNTVQQINLFRPGQPDEEAIRFLQEYEYFALKLDPRGYCVCTSEGKDSRVVGHLMRRAGVKHFYLHNITGIDPPELVYFQRKNFEVYMDMGYEVHDSKYILSMWQLMRKKLIPPLRHKRYCCSELKERRTAEQGFSMISTGVRKAESSRRAKQRSELEVYERTPADKLHLDPYDQDENTEIFRACFDNPHWGDQGLWTINPIAEWPDHWIWDYSQEAHLEQCSLYSEGFERLGCIGCPMAGECGRRREFARWPAFKVLYLRAFAEMLQIRRDRGMTELFKAKNAAEEWFEWWISDSSMEEPVDENQLRLDGFYDR